MFKIMKRALLPIAKVFGLGNNLEIKHGVNKASMRFSLLGVRIDNFTMREALDLIFKAATKNEKQSFAFVNADCLNIAFENRKYSAVLAKQNAVFADGSGIRLAGAMRGIKLRDNVNGTDLFPLLCEQSVTHGHGLFLLGARPGIAAQVAENMQKKFPSLIISGEHHGYFSEDETARVIEHINNSGAMILLVAKGAPHQELWLERHRAEIKAPVVMGVGGLFDFYSGRISRSPLWMRQTGLEWIWRLLQEPKRMWQRYILGNPLFIWRCLVWKERGRPVAPPLWRSRKNQITSMGERFIWNFGFKAHDLSKRLLDVTVASIALIMLSPILIGIALAIKVQSDGPIFFSQTRVGYRGRRFRMWKFRSMYIDAEARRAALLAQSDRSGMHFKMKDDPRITTIGKYIRRASIDELPQLYNVLRGEMSIVGPRPNLEGEVAKYRIDEFGRLDTKPGITCIWQVSGRAEIPWEGQIAMDLDYVYEPSIKTDIGLILRTLPAIISGKGAY